MIDAMRRVLRNRREGADGSLRSRASIDRSNPSCARSPPAPRGCLIPTPSPHYTLRSSGRFPPLLYQIMSMSTNTTSTLFMGHHHRQTRQTLQLHGVLPQLHVGQNVRNKTRLCFKYLFRYGITEKLGTLLALQDKTTKTVLTSIVLEHDVIREIVTELFQRTRVTTILFLTSFSKVDFLPISCNVCKTNDTLFHCNSEHENKSRLK